MATKRATLTATFDVTWDPDDQDPPRLSEVYDWIYSALDGDQSADDDYMIALDTLHVDNAPTETLED